MAHVLLEGISKQFGPVSVIERLDLRIEDREFLVLVGPSGCGRSTVLRLIAGLEELTAGTIRIGGRVVNVVPPKDRDAAGRDAARGLRAASQPLRRELHRHAADELPSVIGQQRRTADRELEGERRSARFHR